MNLRSLRLALFGIQGALVVFWVLNAAHHLRQPHATWSAILDPSSLLMLVLISTLAPPDLTATSEGRVSRRRLALVSGIAVAVALAAFAVGYYASRAAG